MNDEGDGIMAAEQKKQDVSMGLVADNITLRFGGVMALQEMSLHAKEKEIIGIIGPNGAGKTSLINCLTGYYRPSQGKNYFYGEDITKYPSHKIAKLGIGRTFQNIELCQGLTTIDQLLAARYLYMKYNLLSAMLFYGRTRKEEIRHRKVVEEIIDFLEMQSIRERVIGTLPYGLQKRISLGAALAIEPKWLLLDEPMAGMNLDEKEDMARDIIDVHEEMGIPVIMIEHDMGVVMDICDRVLVLNLGVKIAEGSPEEIKLNPEVIEAYLGKGE